MLKTTVIALIVKEKLRPVAVQIQDMGKNKTNHVKAPVIHAKTGFCVKSLPIKYGTK